MKLLDKPANSTEVDPLSKAWPAEAAKRIIDLASADGKLGQAVNQLDTQPSNILPEQPQIANSSVRARELEALHRLAALKGQLNNKN